MSIITHRSDPLLLFGPISLCLIKVPLSRLFSFLAEGPRCLQINPQEIKVTRQDKPKPNSKPNYWGLILAGSSHGGLGVVGWSWHGIPSFCLVLRIFNPVTFLTKKDMIPIVFFSRSRRNPSLNSSQPIRGLILVGVARSG